MPYLAAQGRVGAHSFHQGGFVYRAIGGKQWDWAVELAYPLGRFATGGIHLGHGCVRAERWHAQIGKAVGKGRLAAAGIARNHNAPHTVAGSKRG